MLVLLCLWLCFACSDRPAALIAPDRSEHLLDRPFPSDELRRSDGTVDWSAFPDAGTPLGTSMIRGWTAQASESALGYSALGPIFLRFDGPLDVEPEYAGVLEDPVRLREIDTGGLVPIRARFVADPLGDPFLRPNTLIVAPQPTNPLRSGAAYILEVDRSLARPPETADLPPEAARGVAHATVFTVQDSIGQLRALRAATEAALDANPSWLQPIEPPKRVMRVDAVDGQTPSGEDASVFTATFEDGSTETTYLSANSYVTDVHVDLSDDAMEVWQLTIQTVSFRPLEGAPWASPGLGFLSDFDRRDDGWFHFDAQGQLLDAPVPEPMRVVVQLPRGKSGSAVMTWDHGTGGHAYNAVQRDNPYEDFSVIRGNFADAGVAVVSRDQPLYGTRYPLIDEGFDASLGFYNLGNLPAFRDNQRSGGVDHVVLARFVREVLPELFPGATDPARRGAFGHSLGSVTEHLGLVMMSGEGADPAFASGTGGYLTWYVLDTGLLGSGNDVASLLGALVGVDLPEDATGAEAVAALMGVPEPAWGGFSDLHPAMLPFQTIMDPSDPLVVAPHQLVPEVILLGEGDWQVPNRTTEWLAETLPSAQITRCVPRGDYDPHHCTFREPEGLDALRHYAEGL